MSDAYEDIQNRYLGELREVMPKVTEWWNQNAHRQFAELKRSSAQNDFEARWLAGPVGHPRILHVFRKYFLETELLNSENDDLSEGKKRGQVEGDWGVEAERSDVPFYLPIDLLVYDLETLAPELFEVMSCLVFVPAGMSPDGEYC